MLADGTLAAGLDWMATDWTLYHINYFSTRQFREIKAHWGHFIRHLALIPILQSSMILILAPILHFLPI